MSWHARPRLRPGGRAEDVALTRRGERLTYAEFETLVAAAPIGPMVDISGLPLPELLAAAFAASRSMTTVLVHDPLRAAPPTVPLPRDTWLVISASPSTQPDRFLARTSASWVASVAPLAALAGIDRTDRVLVYGPEHHPSHLYAAVHTLAVGAEVTDDAAAATVAYGGPEAVDTLAAALPADAPLRSLVVTGGAVPPDTARTAADRGWRVLDCFGAPELSLVAARVLPTPLLRPFPQVGLHIDAQHRLWVESPLVAQGYLDGDIGALVPLPTDGHGCVGLGDTVTVPDGGIGRGFTVTGTRARTDVRRHLTL